MTRSLALRAMHAAYQAFLGASRRRFERATHDCESVQLARLHALVSSNANSSYGTAHGFRAINSWRDWAQRVPIVTYEELEPWVRRAAAGERQVLTEAPIRIFERTSGSTSPEKLVPYTDALLAEFGAATGPWLHDLYTAAPALRGTRSYWSISPVTRRGERTAGGTPIGFEDDTGYFGLIERSAIRTMLAVPASVARMTDIDAWRRTTATYLAGAADLGLVSVWHPSFLTLLLREIEENLDDILARLPARRAHSVRMRLGDHTLSEALWPRLAIVSCWTDGAAGEPAAVLAASVPHARMQPKGLLATEGVVSLPLLGGDDSRRVAAVTSHFLEFIDLEHPSRSPCLAHELAIGGTYSPLISTAGGFYRYRIGDAVRCEGYYHHAPLLCFVGRMDCISDLCGEKLSAAHVTEALHGAARDAAVSLTFALVAPSRGTPPRYRLYAEARIGRVTAALGEALDRALRNNHGYAYARELGQLGPLEVVVVENGMARYDRARAARGMQIGNIKPTHLDASLDLDALFDGAVEPTPEAATV